MIEMEKQIFQTVEEYIASFSEPVQELMRTYRSIIREALPLASERMSWQMPTFYHYGNVIHFAGNKKHMGIYPGAAAVSHFKEELKNYKTSKGAIQIPYDQPIPVSLIQEIARFSAKENEMRHSKKK